MLGLRPVAHDRVRRRPATLHQLQNREDRMSNIHVIRGDTQTFDLSLSGLPEGGLTDADLEFTIRGLVAKTLGDGIEVTDPDAGTATITLEAGDTAAAPDRPRSYPFDVQVTFTDGTVKTPVRGYCTVLPDVTPE